MKLDILDYSIYGNEADKKSDALLKTAAESLGFTTRVILIGRDRTIPESERRVWLRYDLRSDSDLDWIIDVAENLESSGRTVFPRSSSILMSEDKWETHLALQTSEVPSVETCRPDIVPVFSGKVILKPRVGWGGNGIKVLESMDGSSSFSLEKPRRYIWQPFISHRQTWTVVIAEKYSVTILEKRPGENDFRTNPCFGESAAEVPDPGDAAAVSVLALGAVGLVTGTVDIIEAGGRLKALEINSAPCLWYDDLPALDLAGPMLKCVMRWMDRCDADSHMHTA